MPNGPFTPEQIAQILEEFFKTVGTRQYIGSRYVPIFGRKDEDSIEWDNTDTYEPLTIVLYQGNSYTSRQYVPVGVEITNQEFWALTGNYNAQVEQYRRETAAASAAADAAQEAADDAQAAADAAQTDIDTLLPKSAFSAAMTVKNYVDNLSRVLPFNTVSEMQEAILKVGNVCHTNGFHAANDGGAAFYVVTDSDETNGMDAIECGNLVANLLVEDAVSIAQLGARTSATDVSSIIQYAITTYDNVIIPNGTWNVVNPVVINRLYGKQLMCYGSVAVQNNTFIVLNSIWCSIWINECYGADSGCCIEMAPTIENATHNNITLMNCHNLEYGIKLVANSDDHGIQYNEFDFQYIGAKYPIYITRNFVNGWVNQNQFNGGRVQGDYGVYIDGEPTDVTQNVNGNTFYNIGYEGIANNAIEMLYGNFNRFVNCRFSESLAGDYWINIGPNSYGNEFSWLGSIGYNRVNVQYTGNYGSILHGEIRDSSNNVRSAYAIKSGLILCDNKTIGGNRFLNANVTTDLRDVKVFNTDLLLNIDGTNNSVIVYLPNRIEDIADYVIRANVINTTNGVAIYRGTNQIITGAMLPVGYHEFVFTSTGWKEI